MNNAIGIIDSGIGGLSVWKEIVKLLPEESTIYLADSKNLPYGEKSEEEVYQLSKPLMMHLIDKDVKLIVIACNTITVCALGRFRKDFPSLPIVGVVPVVKKDVHILDSGEAIARQVQRVLQQEGIESESVLGNHKFYTTGEKDIFEKQIARLVGERSGRIESVAISS